MFAQVPIWVHPAVAIASTSFLVCALLVLTQRWHGRLSHDHDLDGVQKLHAQPVPRIGGVGLFLGLAAGIGASLWLNDQSNALALPLFLCALPVFLAGLVEDLTKRVSVRARLMASFVSAALAVWLVGAQLPDLDIVGLDLLMQVPVLAILFTCFAVGGMTNSVNIVDGLNGLASGAITLMLGGLATIAWMHGDQDVMQLCLWGMAATIGFLVLNYPFGRIFLGDGGAYLGGFWVAECGVLLLARNPEISTWAVLMVCAYPSWETLFSMYRRRAARVASGQPDMEHMHHLVYQRMQGSPDAKSLPTWLQHGLTSAVLWGLVACCQAVAIVAATNTAALVLGFGVFVGAYCWGYRSLTQEAAHEHEHDEVVQAEQLI